MTSAKDIFAQCILPTPCKVFGQNLKPYSIGHAVILERLGVSKLETVGDLLLAVLVCCHGYREFEAIMQSRWFGLRLKWWGMICSWRYMAKLKDHAESFAKYIEEGTTRPHYVLKDSDAVDSKTPFLQHLRATLLSKLNYSPDTVWDTPFTVALWDYLAYYEMQGKNEITDGTPEENDAAMDDKIAKARESMIAYFASK